MGPARRTSLSANPDEDAITSLLACGVKSPRVEDVGRTKPRHLPPLRPPGRRLPQSCGEEGFVPMVRFAAFWRSLSSGSLLRGQRLVSAFARGTACGPAAFAAGSRSISLRSGQVATPPSSDRQVRASRRHHRGALGATPQSSPVAPPRSRKTPSACPTPSVETV